MTNVVRVCTLISLTVLFAYLSMSAQQDQPTEANKPSATGQDEDKSAEALQKATQNPVANLISVPVQNNGNFSVGPSDRVQDVLNIQPVIPVKLNDRWNLITRIIQPIVWQPYPSQNTGGEYCLGDMNPTFFLSPGKPGKVIWGAGPAFVIPTATSHVLGQGKFSIGPSLSLWPSRAIGRWAHWSTTCFQLRDPAAGLMSIKCCCSTSSTTT